MNDTDSATQPDSSGPADAAQLDAVQGLDETKPDRTNSARSTAKPIGPIGWLLITAVSLAAAFGAVHLMLSLMLDNDDQAIDVQTALDGSAAAPLVREGTSKAEVGKHAPNVRLEYLAGGEDQLAMVAGLGKPLVMNFWQSTCIPCLAEMPMLEEMHQELGDKVEFLGINVADRVEDGVEMAESTGVTYRNARDPRSEIFSTFNGIALPRTVLIGADGIVLGTHTGELTETEFREFLTKHDAL